MSEPDPLVIPLGNVIHKLDLDIFEHHQGIFAFFPVHGARKADEPRDVTGTVCKVYVQFDDARRVITIDCHLPDAVPPGNRRRMLRPIMRLNRASMLSAWGLDLQTGALTFRLWQYVVNGEAPEWAAEGWMEMILNLESAREICDVAYGPAE